MSKPLECTPRTVFKFFCPVKNFYEIITGYKSWGMCCTDKNIEPRNFILLSEISQIDQKKALTGRTALIEISKVSDHKAFRPGYKLYEFKLLDQIKELWQVSIRSEEGIQIGWEYYFTREEASGRSEQINFHMDENYGSEVYATVANIM